MISPSEIDPGLRPLKDQVWLPHPSLIASKTNDAAEMFSTSRQHHLCPLLSSCRKRILQQVHRVARDHRLFIGFYDEDLSAA